MSRRIPLISILAVAAVALVVAGCGGGSSDSSASASAPPTSKGQALKLSADPGGQLRFNTSQLTAPKPGTITLQMTNPSSAGMDHGIAVDGNGVDSDGPIVAPGNTSTLTVNLKQGTYTYYCPVPGHRQAGMVGTLTVK